MPALRSLVLRLETLVITEHTHSENNDWQEPGGEPLSVSETPTPQPAMDAPVQEEGQTNADAARVEEDAPALSETHETEAAHAEGQAEVAAESAPGSDTAATEEAASNEEVEKTGESAELPATPEQDKQEELPAAALDEVKAIIEETSITSEDIRTPHLLEGEESALFPLEVETPLSPEEEVRPFTSFIEEFRQNEGHFVSMLNETETSFSPFVAGSESLHEPLTFLETAPEDLAQVVDLAPLPATEQEQPTSEASPAPASQPEEPASVPGLTQPRLSPERPVSPLLRPATRPRLPRHGRHRIDELIHPAELRGDLKEATPAAPVAPAPVDESVSAVEAPAVEEAKPEEPPARPARRYRFDRPATTPGVTPTPTKVSAASTRAGESKEKRAAATPVESAASVEAAPARAAASPLSAPVEAPAAKTNATPEAPAASVETPTPPAPTPTERRRRGNHERAREKEQTAAAAAPTPAPAVTPEPAAPSAPAVEPAPAVAEEVALEDLPPLEYSELQAASSRRRRRRRAGAASTAAASAPSSNGATPARTPLPEVGLPPVGLPPVGLPPTSLPPVASVSMPTPPKSVPPTQPTYNITSGYTVSQMNQGNDLTGPFMGPEPSPARGSTFTPSSVRPVRNEALRNTPAHAKHSGESPLLSTTSVNHLANVISQAMQTQTDRMVAELRRANQVPTNVSVSLPPFPSTERVGVFVDVANLLYSARTLRIAVDFGKLLDFLRGNRRLVRAQAYCPTSPQPGDDQMFLQAVKGLGYRITTKNYKTFSSGAKKADLDLDLCMDVVRLVDGKAVDCIVLVSGDSDFMPMLDYCSDHGVRVEVAAFDESMSATLRQSCDLFVNLSMLEEIRL